jgi:hypothetical protein
MHKLAITGTHPDTRGNAPFDNPDYDIWVFNEAPQADWCKRWTSVFQMHKREVYESPNNMVNVTHWDWLQQDHGIDKTVWMQEVDDRVPNSNRFPLDEIKMFLAGAEYGMFTSTAAQSLALALYLGYEHIEVYGVDLSSNTEYAYQLPGWLYWVGVAKAMIGPGLVLKSGLQHFTNRVYGYEGETQIDRDWFAGRAEHWESEKRDNETSLKKLRDRFQKALAEGRADRIPDIIIQSQDVTIKLGHAAGSLQEAQMYSGRDDPIARQQFERRGAQAQIDGDQKKDAMNKVLGSLEYVFNAWKNNANNGAALNQLRTFYDQYLQRAVDVGGNLGVMQENYVYMNEYDSRITAAGGERTLKALGVG